MVVNTVSELHFVTCWRGMKHKGKKETFHFVVFCLPRYNQMFEFISHVVLPVADVCSCLAGYALKT
jgi:hypothetical protein